MSRPRQADRAPRPDGGSGALLARFRSSLDSEWIEEMEDHRNTRAEHPDPPSRWETPSATSARASGRDPAQVDDRARDLPSGGRRPPLP